MAFPGGEARIDLTFVPLGDYELARTVIHEIADTFTEPGRVAQAWIKYLTQQHRSRDDYGPWKEAARLHCSPTLVHLRENLER